ncbi:hypothetical protein AO501_02065 [Mycobacterium gordonae]|uniref:protein adenylyltransferase n=1 Tax=Mycobacterium gordonae TaxID=1778 RepID=A0A0Q2LUW0_MYCGO|nr:Fic family protein [Mycobacterium gordonae]KQH79586.1 hypothetical protein AO501_02065 [Mycobacterium gordonae]
MEWSDYFWPGTTVLKNNLGLTDATELREAEYQRAAVRRVEIEHGLAPIPKTYDAKHLCALHGWLFQDTYEWAGRFREVPISKQLSDFASVDRIDECLQQATDIVATTRWDHINDAEFADAAARVFCWINWSHPFRDGNGRATRSFLNAVAARSGRWLDYSVVGRDVWLQRCAFSVPTLDDDGTPQHRWLVPLFWASARQLGASREPALPSKEA